GVRAGDTIRLDTPGGLLRLRVAGITNDFTSPRGAIELSRDVYRRMWSDGRITRAFVHTRPGADVPALREEIARRLGRRFDLRILSAAELMEFFAIQVRRAFAAVDVLRQLVLLLVLVGMADTLGAEVVARTR